MRTQTFLYLYPASWIWGNVLITATQRSTGWLENPQEPAMYPTRHAVQRYQQRVAPVSTAEAFRRLAELASHAKVRSTPRWWTPVDPAPGLSFAYPAAEPRVCLLLRDGAILTVFERSQCRSWTAAADELSRGDHARRRNPYRRPSAGSQLGDVA